MHGERAELQNYQERLLVWNLRYRLQVGRTFPTDGGWQLKKQLLKSRRKTLEDSLDRIGAHQCICEEEKSCNRIHLRETAVQALNILWYLIVLFFLVDTIWNPFGTWTKK